MRPFSRLYQTIALPTTRKSDVGFNGGQTPDIVVSGVRGFENQYETVTRRRSDIIQT